MKGKVKMAKYYQVVGERVEFTNDSSGSAEYYALKSSTSESGNSVIINVNSLGTNVILLDKVLQEEDSWFSDAEWLSGEIEADEDIVQGRTVDFPSVEAAIDFLSSPKS